MTGRKSGLPEPECESGYPAWQVEEILKNAGRSEGEFDAWMNGQTRALCEGKGYDYDTRTYIERCGGVAHGGITYSWDLERFLDRKPIID